MGWRDLQDAEATALLERCIGHVVDGGTDSDADGLVSDVRAFLARHATAQPAAPYAGECDAHHAFECGVCSQPAAPETSADTDHWQRAVTAEAQLSAVREYSDSILATGNEECLDALDMANEIERIFNSPTPGGGTGRKT